MSTLEIIGINAAISAIILTILGYTSQIIVIYKNGIKGVSLLMFLLVFYMSLSWLSYGVYLNDWNIILPNIPGVLLSFIIVIQIILRKKGDKKSYSDAEKKYFDDNTKQNFLRAKNFFKNNNK